MTYKTTWAGAAHLEQIASEMTAIDTKPDEGRFLGIEAITEEAICKADQILKGTTEQIDNILLSVEQSAGNTYFSLLPYLNNPEKVMSYCHKMVEANPIIAK